jgi:hypothetical protein
MSQPFVVLFHYFSLIAALGMLACFLVMFLAMLVWMFSLDSTLNVHAPLLDDAPALARRYAAPPKPAHALMVGHRA